MFRAVLHYGGFTMEMSMHGKKPSDVIYIPKPPVTAKAFITDRLTGPELRDPLPVLEFRRHKKRDQYGFEWDYIFVRES